MRVHSSIFLLIIFVIKLNSQSYVKFEESVSAEKQAGSFCAIDSVRAKEILKTITELNLSKQTLHLFSEARVEYICNKLSPLLAASNCEIGKLWVFSPAIYTLVWNAKLTSSDSKNNFEYDYLVAPVVLIQSGVNLDTLVIDFSGSNWVFARYKDWLRKQNCYTSIYTFTEAKAYLFYSIEGFTMPIRNHNSLKVPAEKSQIITGHFWNLPKQDSLTIAKGLAFDELAVYLVDKYYNNPSYRQYKEVIRNCIKPEGIKKLIAGKLISLPKDLVEDCVTYFNQRLVFWKTRVVI